MNYRLSEEAARDLENIWQYTFEHWSLEQADYYLNFLFNEIEHLAENPESGQDFSFVRKGYFRSRVKSHFIFYKIKPKLKIIDVIRVLHQQMDIEARLKS